MINSQPLSELNSFGMISVKPRSFQNENHSFWTPNEVHKSSKGISAENAILFLKIENQL